jgi:hypothetical protein
LALRHLEPLLQVLARHGILDIWGRVVVIDWPANPATSASRILCAASAAGRTIPMRSLLPIGRNVTARRAVPSGPSRDRNKSKIKDLRSAIGRFC